eukprot:CAMPEP_0174272452 /NCGR_PEP_ID=MMETSP0439-20130205/51309_1 /TAXON_ID=0 /ORGANISM="Stereomyxa ramosa, Strain Chinc5" /LENGTH=275 /DNA_ID=CAMNT_0015363031 /DNA_START=38 /DNA_END=865 /DNA_ORIENTATION=-
MHLMLGISAGLLFAIGTLDLIPEALGVKLNQEKLEQEAYRTEHNHEEHNEHEHHHEEHEHQHLSRIPLLGVGCGYLTLLIIDLTLRNYGHAHSHGGGNSNHSHGRKAKTEIINEEGDIEDPPVALSETFSVIALVGLAIHSLVDGIIMAGAFEFNEDMGMRVAWALIIHKVPDGFVMSSIMPPRSDMGYFLMGISFLSMMTPLGTTIGYFALDGINPVVISFILGFGAGTFIFITTTGIVPELLMHESLAILSVGSMVVSYLVFLLVDSTFHAHG